MKVLIGLNTYNDLALLRESLPVLEELRLNLPADVAILDTAHNDQVHDFIKKEFPKFRYQRHKEGNIGYGKSYNEILRANPGYDYFLVVTSDVLLDTAVVKKFLERMENDPAITMCAGKLHHWDLVNHRKTELIDSMGIAAEKRHHFYDRGHGELDTGQYDDELGHFFGISGAVFIFRISAIHKLHGDNATLFDENMWMYKEDIDLSYRLRWLGEKMVIFPEVWAWHARTVANKDGHSLVALTKADKTKRDYGRLHSYKNHLLLLKNNFTWRYGPGVIFSTLLYESFKAGYMLVKSPKVFWAGLKTLLLVPGRRRPKKVSTREMLSHFE